MNGSPPRIQELLFSPSTRTRIRSEVARLRYWLGLAPVWRLRAVRIERGVSAIVYLGREAELKTVRVLLGAATLPSAPSEMVGVVSELPFPGALRVPRAVHMVVPLGRPMEEITAHYEAKLRARLRKASRRASERRILDPSMAERLDREMLRPYAAARHELEAVQLPTDLVRHMASQGGLHLLSLDGREAGCRLGCEIRRGRARYWEECRVGYPEQIFSDPKQLCAANSINLYLGMAWANERGFDCYDMGMSIALPEEGNLQFKRRRGGEPRLLRYYGFLYLRPPRDRARFFYEVPLFSVKRGGLRLHLGIPPDVSAEEVARRYSQLGFRGLSMVCAHSPRSISPAVMEAIRALYAGHPRLPPIVHER